MSLDGMKSIITEIYGAGMNKFIFYLNFAYKYLSSIVSIMAIISMFYGLIISMYYLDQKQHNLPHIHVRYQDEEAVFSIPEGNMLDGTLKANKMRLVQAWIEIHQEELVADWILASQGETVFKIEPLR